MPGGSGWSISQVDGTIDLTGVSCAAADFCLGVDQAGDALISVNGGGGPWSQPIEVGSYRVTGVSCQPETSGGFTCLATDSHGDAIAYDSVSNQWSTDQVDTARLTSVSCPSATECYAVDGAGNLDAISVSPGAPPAGTPTQVDGGNYLTAISCPSTSLCVAVDQGGNVLWGDPGDPTAWTTIDNADGTNALTGVSCASASLCVAVDAEGNALMATNPAGPWSVTRVDDSSGLTGVSCPSTLLCVATDTYGNVLTAAPPVQLDVAVTAGTGAVTGDGISCSSNCAATVELGSTLTVTATPAPGYTFSGWAGGVCSGTQACTTTVLADEQVDATFTPIAVPASGTTTTTTTTPPATRTTTTPTPTTTQPPPPSGPSHSAIVSVLRKEITPSGTAATIRSLLRHRSFTFRSCRLLEAGKLTVTWYDARKHHRRIEVASGSLTLSKPGRHKLVVRLTKAGRTLLETDLKTNAKARIRITGQAAFTPTRQHAVTTTRTFTLAQ